MRSYGILRRLPGILAGVALMIAALIPGALGLEGSPGAGPAQVEAAFIGFLLLVLSSVPGALSRVFLAASRILLDIVLILVTVELASTVWLRFHPAPAAAAPGALPVPRPCPGLVYEPLVMWRTEPGYAGASATTDRFGFRSVPGQADIQPAPDIVMLGGAEAWGTAVPDSATPAALLQAGLRERGYASAVVSDLAQPGWTTRQCIVQLVEELRCGRRPDLVIVYRGVEDAAAAQAGLAGSHLRGDDFACILQGEPPAPVVTDIDPADFLASVRLLGPALGLSPRDEAAPSYPGFADGTGDSLAVLAAVTALEEDVRVLEALSRGFGFGLVFADAPCWALGSRLPSQEEIAAGLPGMDTLPEARFLRAVAESCPGRVYGGLPHIALSHALDSIPETAYADPVSVTPAGGGAAADLLAGFIDGGGLAGVRGGAR